MESRRVFFVAQLIFNITPLCKPFIRRPFSPHPMFTVELKLPEVELKLPNKGEPIQVGGPGVVKHWLYARMSGWKLGSKVRISGL